MLKSVKDPKISWHERRPVKEDKWQASGAGETALKNNTSITNERLKAELVPAKEREVGFMEQIASLDQKIMVLKAGSGKMEEADKKELDKRLHTYLKEIDRCISMLSEWLHSFNQA